MTIQGVVFQNTTPFFLTKGISYRISVSLNMSLQSNHEMV